MVKVHQINYVWESYSEYINNKKTLSAAEWHPVQMLKSPVTKEGDKMKVK